MRKYALEAALIIGPLLATHCSYAETPVLPGSVQPAQISRALQYEQPRQVTGPVAKPSLSAPPAVPAKLLEQAKKIKFKLNKIIIEGNHVYTDKQLEILYAQNLNKTITVADLFTIVQNITNYYRNNGYILTQAILVPQKVTEGIVRIRVIEGYIGNVNVTGTPYGARCLVERYGNRIKACPPLLLSRMEKYLLLANEIPGTQVKAVFSPSKKGIGAADLTLQTELSPVTGYISYDNYGTRYIGPQQMTGNLGFNSIAVSGDAAQFTYVKTPKGGELTYTDVNYSMPVNDEGARWLTGGTRTNTHPLFVLQPLQIDSSYDNYYTSLIFPVIRTRSESLNVRLGFNWLDNASNALDFVLYSDHIRALDIGASYNFADSWNGSNSVNADIKQGLPIFGYTNDVNLDAATSHPGASANYTKIMFNLSRVQPIKGPFSFYSALAGQWGFDPLLASEQFTFGGPILGRGYDVGEFIGDRGLAGSLEIRLDGGMPDFLIRTFQFYAFYDAGEIWNIKATGGLPIKLSGTSTGLGARFSFSQTITGNFMWTQTLTKQVAAEELIGNGALPRMFFSVVASFN